MTDNNADNDDDGRVIGALPGAITSGPITLRPGTEPGTTFAPGDSNFTVDFGFYSLSLGDRVWEDANNNGAVDVSETGVPNVTVRLYRDSNNDGTPDGVAISTTTTGVTGTYLFTGLISDTYIVEIVPPVNYTSSTGTNGNAGGPNEGAGVPDPDNDVNNDDNGVVTGSTIRSKPVTLNAATEPITDGDADSNTNRTIDFGIFQPLSVGHQVWKDANNNGVMDSGEQGLPGITVTLFLSNGVAVSTTVTDAGGVYTFTNLIPGDYYLEIVPAAGYASSTGRVGYLTGPYEQAPSPENNTDNDDNGTGTGNVIRSQIVTLGVGTEPVNDGDTDPNTNRTVDFGLFRPATLGNYVWGDTNVNGQQDNTETGIVGMQVVLYDALTNSLIATTTTGVGGLYTFTNLIPGSYYLEFAQPAGYGRTPSNVGPDATDSDADVTTGRTGVIVVTEGQTDLTWGAGLFQYSSVGDRVWHDLNNDGAQEASEPGVEGVTVTLFYNGVPVSTTLTDNTGFFAFVGITPSVPLSVQVALPNGYIFAPQNVAGNETIDSDVDRTTGSSDSISVPPDTFNRDLDAGIWAPLTLGGQTANDLNNDGTIGAGEQGIANVVMQLYIDSNDNGIFDASDQLVSTTTTIAGGYYTFTNLVQENYLVVAAPANFQTGGVLAGYRNSNFNDATDNNNDNVDDGRPAFNGGLTSGLIHLEAGTEPSGLLNQDNFTVDFGVWLPASLGDYVWLDVDHDGVQDPRQAQEGSLGAMG